MKVKGMRKGEKMKERLPKMSSRSFGRALPFTTLDYGMKAAGSGMSPPTPR